ncbi:YsnF/AvaK domain-containing protein [Allobranchiibius sp. CTAmp26]|uniref:YsnF/AvaK domain-containing protein n=1 Tax=Allobranchiibius sp. CTAmp26 TaxID=2815214 RepID=UPI001AA1A059|nr:YsnF/AvaK domain-containing protein [Allobranchiibius sp. CTAmp26]MBO1753943.1 PRC and DUF2382 domain-containing protein [Allobranchiibius sp. CTAmp26]
MITDDDVQALDGSDAVDRDGRLVGEVDQVYLDDRTGTPTWVAVLTGLASGAQFLPLHEAWMAAGEVTFPYTRDQIARAPKLAPGEHLDVEQERRLYDHYGVEYDDGPPPGGTEAPEGPSGQADSLRESDARGENADDSSAAVAAGGPSEASMRARLPKTAAAPATDDVATPPAEPEPEPEPVTLYEERLVAGTRVRVSGTTRFTKRVVTEERTITVTVRREELVVEHQPAPERATDQTRGGQQGKLEAHPLASTPHEIVLHEEVPVVTMQTRPVETVRIGVGTVTVEEQVTDNVRREYLEGHPPA